MRKIRVYVDTSVFGGTQDDEIADLAYGYIMAKVLGEASIGDALHVAAATVAGADLILSWNFKPIVNFNRIRGFNSVNIRMGNRAMTILSPKEVSDEDEESQDINSLIFSFTISKQLGIIQRYGADCLSYFCEQI